MKSLFENFTSFGALFSPAQEHINKAQEKEDENLYKNSDVIAYEENGADTAVIAGGVHNKNPNGGPAAQTNLTYQRDKINRYRSMLNHPEVEEAVDHIVNDVVTCDEDEDPIAINLEDVEISESVKNKVYDAFSKIMGLMDFQNNGYERILSFYVDGRQSYHKIVDEKKKREGIKRLVMLDPRAIKKVREIVKEKDSDGIEKVKSDETFFVYDPNVVRKTAGQQLGTYQSHSQRLKLSEGMVAYVDSGLPIDEMGFVPGFLEKASCVLNKLRTMEDAMVIYAITRAPEKRAFYLDTGSLPKKSSEEYVKMMMGKFNTSVSYNRETGEISSASKLMGIVEDYWMPRKEGKTATQIETLQGGQQLGETSHILYFLERLYKALKVPKSRIDSGDSGGGLVNIGGSDLAQTTRAEYNFSKFINRIRRRYATELFNDLLRTELILTNVTSEAEWDKLFKDNIKYDWIGDSYIKEQQDNEILAQRIQNMQQVEPYIGTLWSIDSVRKDILKMTDEDIKREQKQIEKEENEGMYGEIGKGDNGEIEPPRNPLKRFE
ncbi:capsid assembly protein [Vibrio phage VP-1]|uniref:Portal protein n=1 Tax=Vibrio phage VP-1 TaxID=2234088 RepID=A0A4P2TH94_9CAUD|nr:capsid assembly protein [Vibrio phage VP-1]